MRPESALRLLAWNCCRGPLATKLAAINALAVDLAVVPECPRLPDIPGSTLWFGANRHGGLGVIAKPPWRIAPLGSWVTPPQWLRPMRVTGPLSFLLWAVWACNDGSQRYVRGIHRALDLSAHWFERGPVVFLGDFNSHSLWDRNHPRDRNHSALVRRLEALGLASSYHYYHAEPHGSETVPTFFEYRHQHRPYHIDYCFLPASWAPWISSVTVGAHDNWSARSDHMPLLTVVEPPSGQPPPEADTFRPSVFQDRRHPPVDPGLARSG